MADDPKDTAPTASSHDGKNTEADSPAQTAAPSAPVGPGSEGDEAAVAAKKTKSKKSKGKAASSDESKLKQALAGLPPAQAAELLKLNPAVSQEIGSAATTATASTTATAAASDLAAGNLSPEAALQALQRLSLADIMTGMAAGRKNVKDMASYKFWQTQPVPKFGEEEGDDALPGAAGSRIGSGSGSGNGSGSGGGKSSGSGSRPPSSFKEGPILVQTVDDVPKEPPKLVDGFEWDTLDLTDDHQLQEVFDLLSGHFVEDSEAMFRFRYSREILRWAMMSPGWIKDWHVGVRATQSRKLVAFISAIPLELRIRDKVLHASEVNFLVIHKKLRSKRLAPILIKEITRLCNLRGVWQALYTAGVVLPKPVSTARYFHRSLDWQKLYDVGFSPLPPNSKPQYQVRKFALPEHTRTRGLREMQARDVDAVQRLLTAYLARYDMAMEFTREEVAHWLLDKKVPGGEQVVYTYVVEDDKKNITDMFSFYGLDSSVINNPRHDVIRAAYLFYYATTAGLGEPLDKPALKTRLNELIHDALILAKRQRFDVFNGLSIMDNALFLDQQKFGRGDGQLHYYLFNYRALPIAGGVDQNNELDEETLSGIGFTMM